MWFILPEVKYIMFFPMLLSHYVDITWLPGISDCQYLNCLFNSLFRLRTRKIWNVHITGLLWGESTSPWWIPLTKGQYCIKEFPNHGTVMPKLCIYIGIRDRLSREWSMVIKNVTPGRVMKNIKFNIIHRKKIKRIMFFMQKINTAI